MAIIGNRSHRNKALPSRGSVVNGPTTFKTLEPPPPLSSPLYLLPCLALENSDQLLGEKGWGGSFVYFYAPNVNVTLKHAEAQAPASCKARPPDVLGTTIAILSNALLHYLGEGPILDDPRYLLPARPVHLNISAECTVLLRLYLKTKQTYSCEHEAQKLRGAVARRPGK